MSYLDESLLGIWTEFGPAIGRGTGSGGGDPLASDGTDRYDVPAEVENSPDGVHFAASVSGVWIS